VKISFIVSCPLNFGSTIHSILQRGVKIRNEIKNKNKNASIRWKIINATIKFALNFMFG